ncbi:hypothetical protein F8M41_002571 [Gigaspora margarita]|uniref:Uncharacterized protein n=1 Tax=Gigaspora margarita TaxID=4874 RepID=A0A8H4AYM4_GIGMA|nr:hypothetical protein F8M41_002571 [Gigaspora margarita]
MSKKSLRKKVKKDVPSTAAGTSGASTQSSNVTEIAENVPSLQKEQSISSGKLDFKIWVKYGDSEPTQILFEGEIVDDLKRAVKKELSPELDSVTVDDITIRKHGEEISLVLATLKCKHEESENLSEIVQSALREELSRQKPDETIQASNLSETKARKIIGLYGLKLLKISEKHFQPIEPIQCPPFIWDIENDEARQMSEVEKWFENALDLLSDFHVKDIHTQNYQQHLQTANVVLTGGTNISVGPSDTSCVWIEVKKTSSTIHNRSIALAIIKQFVLDEGRIFLNILGWSITYQTNLPTPLKKRTKFRQSIPEEHDERMADIIDDMTEKKLRNMTMRKRLRLAKSIVSIEELPIIDQLIGQFSDDYESS